MKVAIILSVPLSLILSVNFVLNAPVNSEDKIQYLDQSLEGGNYHYNFSLTDGHHEYAKGTLKDIDGTKVVVVEGSYGYEGPDNYIYEVFYVADENGFVIKKITKVYRRRTGGHHGHGHISQKAVASLLAG